MAMRLRRPHATKEGPPVFSQEFIIQNHADIISCICMVVFLGLVPETTNWIAASFIFLQYNQTVEVEADQVDDDSKTTRVDTKPQPETMYLHGIGDLLNIFFYMLVWIIVHAMLQEYVWERMSKRLHLSKNKTAKYLDSGMLAVFYALSLVWGVDHIIKEGYFYNWNLLWEGYPHTLMRMSLKFYMLAQIAFWLHCYPELYLLKAKKEEIYSKLVLCTSSLLIISGAYVAALQRLALLMLVCHYSTQFFFHSLCLFHYHGNDKLADPGFKVWKVLFVLVRIFSIIISVVTLWFGLNKVLKEREESGAEPVLGVAGLDFLSPLVRTVELVFVLAVQLWISFTFFTSQLERSSGSAEKPTTLAPMGKKLKDKTTPTSSPRAKSSSNKRKEN